MKPAGIQGGRICAAGLRHRHRLEATQSERIQCMLLSVSGTSACKQREQDLSGRRFWTEACIAGVSQTPLVPSLIFTNLARKHCLPQHFRVVQRIYGSQITSTAMSLGGQSVSNKAVAEQQEHGKVVKGGQAATAQVKPDKGPRSLNLPFARSRHVPKRSRPVLRSRRSLRIEMHHIIYLATAP